jgi:formyltetrahydrofolate deformylase
MRLESELTNPTISLASIRAEFQQTIATDFNMSWDLYNKEVKPKWHYLYPNTIIVCMTF